MGPEPASLAAADFDGDGLADLAVVGLGDGAIRVRPSPAAPFQRFAPGVER